ncbi:hypothetical protein [Xenorhabdus sp. SGI240]|uniref:hypothetical protein n=1 Tax=Xenorhabdus sp. SGI240 TaxID=3158262 RepID=UPI0032B7EFE2
MSQQDFIIDFGWRQMTREREKRATLKPLYEIFKGLQPRLGISQKSYSFISKECECTKKTGK